MPETWKIVYMCNILSIQLKNETISEIFRYNRKRGEKRIPFQKADIRYELANGGLWRRRIQKNLSIKLKKDIQDNLKKIRCKGRRNKVYEWKIMMKETYS